MLDGKKQKYKLYNHRNDLKNAGRIGSILLLIILVYTAPASIADDSDVKDNGFLFFNHTESFKHEKIESSLLQERYEVIAEKTSAGLVLSDKTEEVNLIEVVIKLNSSDHSYIEILEENGAVIEAIHRNLVYAQIPVLQINVFSELQFVQYIRARYLPLPAVESQGVGVINADDLHDEGITGENVKIAVIDVGFYGYDNNSEIPDENIIEAVSFTGDITGRGERHGTACAEVILDVAPEAGLYLLNVHDESEFESAVNYAIDNDVDVITCPIGWSRGPFNGTGLICDIANEAYDNGIIFINSIGNQARRHWEGNYNECTSDVEGETWYVHNFSSGDVTNSFTAGTGRIHMTLSWNDWPESDKDYDLYLVNQSSGTIVTFSENAQTGTQEPYEEIIYDVTTPGVYGVIIRKTDSNESVDFELYSYYHLPEYNVESSSLMIPADSAKVMAVGATDWSNDSLEFFSSRGPTNDGRTKPDVVAPDNVSNSIYTPLYGSFRGTSASTSHVAGAAALILSVNPSLTPDELQSILESTALDLGDVNSYGSGRINVYQAVQELDITPLASISDLDNTTYGETYINWTWTDPEDSDFSHVKVYLDGLFKDDIPKGIEFYNATGLAPDTEYEIGTHTVDLTGSINLSWENNTARTKQTSDTPPPLASISDLDNTTYEETYINWTWTDPEDSDFSHVKVYLDGLFEDDIPKGVEFYNATGLAPDTEYEIGTHTVDLTGSINLSWENNTARTKQTSDTPPPLASISDLDNTTYEETYINWTWTDPEDSDFSHVKVYLDGLFKDDIPKGIEFYNATGLAPDTEYEIGTHTVDLTGSINLSWENNTARTKQTSDTPPPPASISDLDNTTYEETYINWTWTDPEDSDFSHVKVYLDGLFEDDIPKGVEFYNATGLAPDTEYEIGTHTVDLTGSINPSWENNTARTKQTSDTPPPLASISDLDNTTYEETYINWTWTDPEDSDFSHVKVYLDGLFEDDIPKGVEFYNATGLAPDTEYEIGTHTVDLTGSINLSWENNTARTKQTSDTPPPPASISDLDNTTYEETYINWTWTDPEDSNFSHVKVYLDGLFKDDIPKGIEFYNATGLAPDTEYEIGTHTVDLTGSINLSWENNTARTKQTSDTPPPPASISDLDNTTYEETYINWTWTDPEDSDFSHVKVYLNGLFKDDIPKGIEFYNATGLAPDTEYEIGTHTVDLTGSINLSWENNTARTKQTSDTPSPPASISDLDNTTYEETYINWTWTDPEDSDFSHLKVYLDGLFKDDIPKGIEFYNATDLAPDTEYEIGTHTVDLTGSINLSWENNTVRTKQTSDTTPPIISTPADKIIEQTTSGNIIWSIIELHPAKYWILINGTQVIYKNYESGNNITVPINTTIAGDWNYTIIATDTSENIASNQVNISISDTSAPIITDPSNQLIEANASGNIIWKITDANPDQYWVLRNSSLIIPPTNYKSDIEVNILINTSKEGRWNYTIFASDTSGNVTSAYANITVQETIPPVMTSPPDQSIERCYIKNITWIVTDGTPDKYWIFENGKQVVPPSDFQSGHVISYRIDTSRVGPLDYTIFANDTSTSENISSDQVEITVVEEKPLDVSITSPSDGYDTTSMTITVSGTVDGNCSIPTVSVNGNEAQLDLDDGCVGTFSALLIPLEIGTNFITATATNNNSEHKESNTIEVTRRKVITAIPSGGGGGSSGGASGENYDNILISETQRESVSMGEKVSYHFNADGNIIMNINFTGLISAGIIPAKVEILNDTSSLVNYAPPDTEYKNVNIWVGNIGWATSKNIANSTISFKVDKSWVNENSIDRSFIRMNRFFNGQWNPLPTSLTGQDDEYLYFICETQGFSSFVVTGKSMYIDEAGGEGITVKPSAITEKETLNNSTAINTSAQEDNGIGLISVLVFGLLAGLVILVMAVLSRKN